MRHLPRSARSLQQHVVPVGRSEILQRLQRQSLAVDQGLEASQTLGGPDRVVGFRNPEAVRRLVRRDDLGVFPDEMARQMGYDVRDTGLPCEAQRLPVKELSIQTETELHDVPLVWQMGERIGRRTTVRYPP